MAYSTIWSVLGFSNALRLPTAKAKPCSIMGRSILMSIRFTRQVCSKPLWALFCLPKPYLPGFILPKPLPKDPPANTSVHLAWLIITVTQPLRRHICTIRSSWLDHMRFCHLTLVFAISTVLPCVMLRNEAVH